MVKLSNHSRNLRFSFLVTPSFTKEDDPVSVRFTPMRVEKCTILRIIIQKFSGGRSPNPLIKLHKLFPQTPKGFLGY